MTADVDGISRSGFVVGFALGGGRIRDAQDSVGAFGFRFDIGLMAAPNVAILFDYATLAHALNHQDTFSHDVSTIAAQIFFARFLWAKGGLGLGHLSISDAFGNVSASSESSLVLALAAGAELLQTTGGFALDIQLHTAGARYGGELVTNSSLLLGFNWY